MVELSDLEDAAGMLLRETGLEGHTYVDPLQVFHLLGYELEPDVPRGCRGAWTGDPPKVRVSMRGDVTTQQEHSRHEGGHLLLVCCGVAFPHDEKRLVPQSGLVLSMPRAGVRDVVRAEGLDPRAWMGRYPLVSPMDVLRRVAMVDDLRVVVRARRSGRVLVANDNALERESLEFSLRESALIDSVHVRDEAIVDAHGVVTPMMLDGRACTVSVFRWT